MQVIYLSLHNQEGRKLPEHSTPQVLAIGDFDGIHLGHDNVLRSALEAAERRQFVPAVMTFDPHPRTVLGQTHYSQLITPLQDKLDHFASMGMKRAYVVRFEPEFARLEPHRFVDEFLSPLGIDTVVVGFDFTFGYKGAGTVDTMGALAKGRFTVEVVRPFTIQGEKVSSTVIRDHIQSGRVEKASHLLGRPYSIRGTVVRGEGRGRTIGIPTANVEPADEYVIPKRGVYAVLLTVDREKVKGVMNIGLKPTFVESGMKETLEAHLFGFNRDIYGRSVTVEFFRFIRDERKFGSADELVKQIQSDIRQAEEMLR